MAQIDPMKGLELTEISYAIKNASGPRSALFIPQNAFEMLVKKQVLVFQNPSIQCVDTIFEELERIVTLSHNSDLNRFQNLSKKIHNVTSEFLESCRQPCKEMIRNLFLLETSYININHPDFQKVTNRISAIQINQSIRNTNNFPPPQQQKSIDSFEIIQPLGPLVSEQDVQEVQVVEALLESYFSIISKNIQDIIPKTIMHLLVNKSKLQLHHELVIKILAGVDHDNLLEESAETITKRKNCFSNIQILQKADEMLNSIKDSNIQ